MRSLLAATSMMLFVMMLCLPAVALDRRMIAFNGSPVVAREWYHLAATWMYGEDAEAAFYLNGVPWVEEENSGAPMADIPVARFRPISWIGLSNQAQYSAENGANGTFDEFRMYSTVLNPDEVVEAMETGAAVEPLHKAAVIWARLRQ